MSVERLTTKILAQLKGIYHVGGQGSEKRSLGDLVGEPDKEKLAAIKVFE